MQYLPDGAAPRIQVVSPCFSNEAECTRNKYLHIPAREEEKIEKLSSHSRRISLI